MDFKKSISTDENHRRYHRPLAKTILVFMVRGAVCNIEFPYAVFSCLSPKGGDLFPLHWQAIERLTRNGFRILAVTSDGASCNRKLFQMHSKSDKLVHKVRNIFSRDNHDIYFVSDPPHLIKTIRNCLANSKRKLWVCSYKLYLSNYANCSTLITCSVKDVKSVGVM